MEWRRIIEGVLVVVLLVAALAVFGDPTRTLTTLESVNLTLFAVALGLTLAGMLVWSETLSILLRVQDYTPRLGRFQTIYVAGMGIRSIIPGGSTSGPAVLAYIVARTTNVNAETSIAMAYVNEVFLWIGSTVIGTVCFLVILVNGHLSPILLELAEGITALAIVVFGVLGYGILHPDVVEARVRWLVTGAHAHLDRYSSVFSHHLHPDDVEESLDRFFDAFARLADDPSHFSPAVATATAGWVVHASSLYVIFLAIGVHPSLAAALFIVPVGGLAEGLSVLPGGIGSVEPGLVALILLLTPVNVATATTIVILYRLSNYWFRVGLGFVALPILGIGDALSSM